MNGDNMMLVGSSPPTQRGGTPGPTGDTLRTEPYSGTSSILNSYFRGNGRAAVQQKKALGTRHGGDVNEMHSSSRSSEANWQQSTWKPKTSNVASFSNGTKKSHINSTNILSNQKIKYDERPVSTRSTSYNNTKSRPSSAKRPNFKPTYVDELLFGKKLAQPDFSAPWNDGENRVSRGIDSSPYKKKEVVHSSRPNSGARVPRHSASYVDETLFGPKPVDPEWEAPWSKPDHRRINIYDAFQHKVTIQHKDVEVVRPKSAIYLRKARPASSGKPPWK